MATDTDMATDTAMVIDSHNFGFNRCQLWFFKLNDCGRLKLTNATG